MEFEIERDIKKICDCAVKALGRFCKLTDLEPEKMHESFMASYVFDHLGRQIPMVPEVTVSTLWQWDKTENDITPPMPPPVKKLQRKRIDLALFAPQEFRKEDQHIWALVEFKRRGEASGDYHKLAELLPFFEGCQYGAACGVIDAEITYNQKWLTQEGPREAEADGYRLIASAPWRTKIGGRSQSFVVFAYLFTLRRPV